MSVKTVLLGLLRKGPLHGYELKQIIEREMGDWTDIAFGSIYFALDKLAKEGFVTPHAEEGNNHRPARIVYTITTAGEAEYFTLLRGLWTENSRKSNPIDIAVAFMHDLPAEEVQGYLSGRAQHLEKALVYLDEHEKETMSMTKIPPESRLIFSHAKHQISAELDWTREIQKHR